MRIPILAMLALSLPVFAQEPTNAENPLAQLKMEVDRVLGEAEVPFTPAQNGSVILMMEERRRASEELFGGLMDFQQGPTQGREADRLRSAIEWMRGEFLANLAQYLTPDQAEVWNRFVAERGLEALVAAETEAATAESDQTLYVRIHNNVYTAEDDQYRLARGGGSASSTEVIDRGGVGAWHGNAEFLIKDDGLNARNPTANNKPQYQERQTSFDVSGPLVRGWLTSSFGVSQNEAENVGTINAILADGNPFTQGIVRPTTNRSYNVGNTLRLAEQHSLEVDFEYGTSRQRNQGMGGFVLPERAYTSTGSDWEFEIEQFSALSGQSLYETRFEVSSNRNETIPVSEGLQINVRDAFESGGAQNRSEATNRDYMFGNMYTRLGDLWTLKTGLEGVYRTRRSFAEDGFGGQFTFSSLEDLAAGVPAEYRQSVGDPELEINQFEIAGFVQNDFKLTPEFTLMLGLRYEAQTNLSDYNNFGPRLGFAWGIGQNTVVRGGSGVFNQRYSLNVFERQQRFDGARQYEISIAQPSYPDPFLSGDVEELFPTLRVTDPDLAAPYLFVSGAQLERTFFTNLFLSASYHVSKDIRRHRLRNINAPLPACVAGLPTGLTPEAEEAFVQSCRPDPTRVHIYSLESTGSEFEQIFRVNYRQRFSIFNVSAGYTWNRTFADGFPSNNPSLPTDNYDLRSDWARAPFPHHDFNTSINARLPLGVFLTSRVNAAAGRGYTITTGSDNNRDGEFTDRPAGVARNSEVGPGLLRVDFNISKAFFVGSGGANMNVFANMTNAFNRANLNPPSGVMSSRNFGRSTSAQNPREIEAGIRFQF